ncbi:MAG: DNA topology modulation protein [Bacteroidota bacterium]
MKRIMIIGCCGAGKSTLSRKLHQQTQLPLIHLDQYYWKDGWVESEKEEWEASVTALAAKDQWIIDGNYNGTVDIRLKRADTIVFMDYPTIICLWRVILRILKNYGRARADMQKGCPERFSLSFLLFVLHFRRDRRPTLLKKMDKWKDQKQLIILQNDAAVSHFLDTLPLNNKQPQK